MQQTVLADDTLELSLANDLREMSVVAAEIDEFCTAQHLATEIAYAANLAIEELLTNSISHGYDDDEPHRIEIILRREPDDLVIVIVDDSAPFDPSRKPDPDVAAPLADRDPGGLGLLLVHQVMDGIEYRRLQGCNIVTLTKNIARHG